MWGDFIDWEKRRLGEKGFLERELKKRGCVKVLDAACGDGCDSIHLLKKGFRVTSNEIDPLFVEKALSNARRQKTRLNITSFDWREFDEKFEENGFDAITLLGNSLTYLFNKKDRLKALDAFKNVLKPSGVLLVDERNYQYMLDHRKQALAGNFRYGKKVVYCGERVHAKPVEIRENRVVLKYEHENGKTGFLKLYPFKKGELLELLEQAGFRKTTQYSDYKPGYDYAADFHQYVAIK